MQNPIENLLIFSKTLNLLVIGNEESLDYKTVNYLKNLFKKVTYIDSSSLSDFNLSSDFNLVIVSIKEDKDCLLLDKIKRENETISIIVMSNFESATHRRRALETGVSGYLLTPINFNQLNQELTKIIEDIKFKQTQVSTIDKLTHALNLSKEYELAINESNILSRTNLSGKITFVNDKFCKVSGYLKEELLGQNHNIVSHPDTPKSVFKDLWNHINQGKIWKSILKNKNKQGNAYWVNTTIIPIKDQNEKIVEFMAIRHNLSEQFSLQKEIEDTQREIIYKMGEVGETRSKETGHHVKRVAEYSKELAFLCGLEKKEAEILFSASPMHDIGKVGISDDILKKPGKLTSSEFETMKTHAEIGYNILKDSKRDILKAAAIVALTHHEKFDGSGYPKGLKAYDIHIYGRITAIADVFDALGSDRVYKKAWKDEKIFELLNNEKGKHFDPFLIELFMKNINIFLDIREKYKG